jgi:hypothetical protein
MLALSFALLLLYAVAVVACWPSTREPAWWAWPSVPILVAAVKLWDERATIGMVVGAYGATILLLFLGYRINVFLLG